MNPGTECANTPVSTAFACMTSGTPFASRALALGESLPLIARLLGHTKIQMTARYAHLARDSIRVSAARVAASIGKDILLQD